MSISRRVCIAVVDANANSSHLLWQSRNRILPLVKSDSSTSDAALGQHLALAELRRGQVALVTGLVESAALDSGRDASQSLLTRLRDLGFVPGARCEVVARMWLGGDPLAVRIGGSTFALRRTEAHAVRVKIAPGIARENMAHEGTGAVPA
jgi:ferrous iron transport protein A